MTHKQECMANQAVIVIKQLMDKDNMNRGDACKVWYESKTKEEIIKRDLYYISGMRCYWELMLELSKHKNWMNDWFG